MVFQSGIFSRVVYGSLFKIKLIFLIMFEYLVSQDGGYIILNQNTFGLDGLTPPHPRK